MRAELVPCVTIDALQALGHFVRPGHVPDRDLVDIELPVTELHCASDYDYDNDNRSAVAGLTTRALPNMLVYGKKC